MFIGDEYSSKAHADFMSKYVSRHYEKPEWASFIYLVGILRVTREHFQEIIDLEDEVINPECLQRAWVTPLARRTLMLAFNLYSNWIPDEYLEDCTPSALFDNEKIRRFLLKGVDMRYKKREN